MISDLLEAKFAHTIDDYWLTDDGTAFLRYDARGGDILWEVRIRTARAARLAETMRVSRDAEHADDLARLQGEIDQLREDLGLRTRDFQDAMAINAGLQAELAAAQARITELEAARASEHHE